MLKTIRTFTVDFLQILDDDGNLRSKDFHKIDKSTLKSLYYNIVKTRAFDKKAISLQRTGKLGTFPSSYGQEAIFAVMGHLMRPSDILCPYYRDQGAMLQRGVLIEEILAYWGGDERGNCYKNQLHDFPLSVPIASQCMHAVGIAYAQKYKKANIAIVTTLGEGGTSKGDFYEAMNFASLHNLPVVFIINNNKWAISVSSTQQSKSTTFAQKAIAMDIENLKVDGNDVYALHYALSTALNKAYADQGPTVIEAETYRLCDHTTADDASRYVPREELDIAASKEPLIRLKKHLENDFDFSESEFVEIEETVKKEIDNGVKKYHSLTPQDNESMTKYLYSEDEYATS